MRPIIVTTPKIPKAKDKKPVCSTFTGPITNVSNYILKDLVRRLNQLDEGKLKNRLYDAGCYNRPSHTFRLAQFLTKLDNGLEENDLYEKFNNLGKLAIESFLMICFDQLRHNDNPSSKEKNRIVCEILRRFLPEVFGKPNYECFRNPCLPKEYNQDFHVPKFVTDTLKTFDEERSQFNVPTITRYNFIPLEYSDKIVQYLKKAGILTPSSRIDRSKFTFTIQELPLATDYVEGYAGKSIQDNIQKILELLQKAAGFESSSSESVTPCFTEETSLTSTPSRSEEDLNAMMMQDHGHTPSSTNSTVDFNPAVIYQIQEEHLKW